MQTHYNTLIYRIELYFHDHKLAIEIDENGYSNRTTDYEIKSQRTIDQKLGCTFIRIDSYKEDFDIFKTANEIFRNIKQSTKKTLKTKFQLDY